MSLPCLRAGGALIAIEGGYFRRHLIIGERLPEIKEASPPLFRAVQDTVLDLQSGDALSPKLCLEACFFCRRLHSLFRGDPAVAISEDDDKKGTAPLDLGKAYLQHEKLFCAGFVHRDDLNAPSQIYGLEMVPP